MEIETIFWFLIFDKNYELYLLKSDVHCKKFVEFSPPIIGENSTFQGKHTIPQKMDKF